MRCQKRISELTRRMKKDGLDAFIVSKPENIFYLTSFLSDSIILVVSPKKKFAITDFRYAEAAGNKVKGFELIILGSKLNTFSQAISAVLEKSRTKKVGFEASSLTFLQYKNIELALRNKALRPCTNLLESLREIKDSGEIDAIKRAFAITKEALKEVKRVLSPNITEREVVLRIKESFIRQGAEGAAFEPIVATQPGASEPHYSAKAKKLGKDKPILVDLGAKYNGYNSDLTRVLPLGKMNTKFTALYQILLEAQKRAMDIIRPGARISDLDNAARQYIACKGFGRFFGHSLGHGIGLEVHEKPTISARNTGLLREGMVFTVEPGIYIPGSGGLRLEDTVLVTKKGCRTLTHDIY
ncbi:MAG: Xaa-Pro peptidase family protein [Candidatus Omnitrophota bacterium]